MSEELMSKDELGGHPHDETVVDIVARLRDTSESVGGWPIMETAARCLEETAHELAQANAKIEGQDKERDLLLKTLAYPEHVHAFDNLHIKRELDALKQENERLREELARYKPDVDRLLGDQHVVVQPRGKP